VLSSVVLNGVILIARDGEIFYANLFTQTSDIFQLNVVIFWETACAIKSFYLHKVSPLIFSIIR
jgi:hypothetical protein